MAIVVLCATVLKIEQISYPVKLFLCVAIVTVPNGGPIFNNLTNSQWLYGAALALIIAYMDSFSGKEHLPFLGLALLSSLQGPFSILYVPALCVRGLVSRDLKKHASLYVSVLFGATVETFVLFFRSSRLNSATLAWAPIETWAHTLAGDLLGEYGGPSAIGHYLSYSIVCLALALFLGMLWKLSRGDQKTRSEYCLTTARPVVLLSLCGATILVGSYYISRNNPSAISPYGGGARYFYIPYFLFTVVFVQLAHSFQTRLYPYGAALLLLIPMAFGFQREGMLTKDLYWQGYVALAKCTGPINAPTLPQWPVYPGWHANLGKANPGNAQDCGGYRVPTRFSPVNLQGRQSLRIVIRHETSGKGFVGVRVTIVSSAGGFAQMSTGKFSKKRRTIERFYPSGRSIEYFVLPSAQNTGDLVYDVKPPSANSKITGVVVHRLVKGLSKAQQRDTASVVVSGQYLSKTKTAGNTPLPLARGQSATATLLFAPAGPRKRAIVRAVGVLQGNNFNTADGRLAVRLCDADHCVNGERPLSESRDNKYFFIPLRQSLSVRSGSQLQLAFTHRGGHHPETLWLWPSMDETHQVVTGPNGEVPGEALRITITYSESPRSAG